LQDVYDTELLPIGQRQVHVARLSKFRVFTHRLMGCIASSITHGTLSTSSRTSTTTGRAHSLDMLGDGLITQDDPHIHAAHRRIVNPAFSPQTRELCVTTRQRYSANSTRRWGSTEGHTAATCAR
jgi:cytochrome P450